MINGVALFMSLTFHKWIIVFLLCYALGGYMLAKMIDRLGKETDSVVLARRKIIFYIIYLLFIIGTLALLKDIGAFKAFMNTYHKAIEVTIDTAKAIGGK